MEAEHAHVGSGCGAFWIVSRAAADPECWINSDADGPLPIRRQHGPEGSGLLFRFQIAAFVEHLAFVGICLLSND
jgi:hypothetical protein